MLVKKKEVFSIDINSYFMYNIHMNWAIIKQETEITLGALRALLGIVFLFLCFISIVALLVLGLKLIL
jgi:hypothetical protein